MKKASKDTFRIIFICSGNVCRSPMAQASLKAKIPKTLKDSVEILSAGIRAFSGLTASTEAELAARLKGYELSRHRSEKASSALLETCDLILCMEPEHTGYLKQLHPNIAKRIHTLKAFGGGVEEAIPDPFQMDIFEYQRVLDLIDKELNRIKTSIWKSVRKKMKGTDIDSDGRRSNS